MNSINESKPKVYTNQIGPAVEKLYWEGPDLYTSRQVSNDCIETRKITKENGWGAAVYITNPVRGQSKDELDRDIEVCAPDDRAAYFVSGVTMVDDVYLFREYKKAIKIIDELKRVEAATWKIGTDELADVEATNEDFLTSARGM